jgi:Fe-S-cluster containining protein
MDIAGLSAQVEGVFDDLDRQIADFKKATALHCPAGCGKCCFKPDIEATVLEFIPLALALYRQQLAWRRLERLNAEKSGLCPVLAAGQTGAGLCSEYAHRGLICRLFGYSARLSKHRSKELVTCTIIKTGQTGAFEEAGRRIAQGLPVPVMSDFYMRLHAIDADLSRDFFPIREAIRRALETVLHYYAYHTHPCD